MLLISPGATGGKRTKARGRVLSIEKASEPKCGYKHKPQHQKVLQKYFCHSLWLRILVQMLNLEHLRFFLLLCRPLPTKLFPNSFLARNLSFQRLRRPLSRKGAPKKMGRVLFIGRAPEPRYGLVSGGNLFTFLGRRTSSTATNTNHNTKVL